MYQTDARRQARIRELPVEVWSPFMGRATRWSALQHRIASVALTRDAESGKPLTQAVIAARVGCSQGTVSKTLAMMQRLGVLAVRTIRGRFGRTLARLREGVQRMIPPQGTLGIGGTDIRTAQESLARGGASLADILAGMGTIRPRKAPA